MKDETLIASLRELSELIEAVRHKIQRIVQEIDIPKSTASKRKLPFRPPPMPEGLDGVHEVFGEIQYIDLENGMVKITNDFELRHMTLATGLPFVGRLYCNRGIEEVLRYSLKAIYDEVGIDTIETIGCFNPRHKRYDESLGLSMHAYGIALDINAKYNPYGKPSRQDPRLVRIMEDIGWVWGGRWSPPDAMHFQWARGV